MSQWPSSVTACASCGCEPERRRYGNRKFCYRCLYYIERRDAAQKWTYGQPDTYAAFKMDMNLSWLSPEKFEAFKRGYLRQIQRELGQLAARERHRRGELDNLDLEYKFDELRQLLDRKADQPMMASYLASHFTTPEMGVIYGLLDDIIEDVERNSDRRAVRAGYDSAHQLDIAAI